MSSPPDTSRLAAEVLTLCRARGWMLATAESCTGGLIAGALTAIPGSSDVVDRGFVTYSNTAKRQMLGVSQTTLDRFGAVSEETAAEMASGASRASQGALAISVTGIAGPGGSEHKPEGLVCFGLALPGRTVRTQQVALGALGRDIVRRKSVDHALTWIIDTLR